MSSESLFPPNSCGTGKIASPFQVFTLFFTSKMLKGLYRPSQWKHSMAYDYFSASKLAKLEDLRAFILISITEPMEIEIILILWWFTNLKNYKDNYQNSILIKEWGSIYFFKKYLLILITKTWVFWSYLAPDIEQVTS